MALRGRHTPSRRSIEMRHTPEIPVRRRKPHFSKQTPMTHDARGGYTAAALYTSVGRNRLPRYASLRIAIRSHGHRRLYTPPHRPPSLPAPRWTRGMTRLCSRQWRGRLQSARLPWRKPWKLRGLSQSLTLHWRQLRGQMRRLELQTKPFETHGQGQQRPSHAHLRPNPQCCGRI